MIPSPWQSRDDVVVMKRERGRSLTVREHSTNAQTVSQRRWWRRLAIGDSSWAFLASFLLLVVALAISALLGDDHGSITQDCRPDPLATPALRPGDLDQLFKRITSEYNDTVEILHRQPWIITLNNFLSDDEADKLVEHGREAGFQRSFDVGGINHVGKVTPRRTSETAWCTAKSGCRGDRIPDRIHERISKLLGGIPKANSEDFQVLSYKVGQCKSLFG